MTIPTESTDPTGPVTTSEPGKDAGAEELEADIARTRQHLGHTVDALSAKLDVKSQTQHKIRTTKQRATEQAAAARARSRQIVARAMTAASDEHGKPKPAVPAGAAVVVAGLVVAVVVVYRSRR